MYEPVVSPDVREALTVNVSLFTSEPEVIEYPKSDGSEAFATLLTDAAVISIDLLPKVIVAGSEADE